VRLNRGDPGECIVCGAAHCACGGGGPIEVVQLPARDAAAVIGVDLASGPDHSVEVTLGDGSDGRPVSTATYRGLKKNRRP
jgi:hypothetical protein